MIDDNTIIRVTNRFDGYAGYALDDGTQRNFNPGEKRDVTMKELRSLSYLPGGSALLSDYFVLDNKEAIEELIGKVEMEYFYTEKEIQDILLNGSYEAFLDTLDYAPAAVIDIIKSMAVQLEINDVKKREAIYQVTGFNVNNAIENLKAENLAVEKEGKVSENTIKTRRVQNNGVEKNSSGRRVAATDSKYKVISVNE